MAKSIREALTAACQKVGRAAIIKPRLPVVKQTGAGKHSMPEKFKGQLAGKNERHHDETWKLSFYHSETLPSTVRNLTRKEINHAYA